MKSALIDASCIIPVEPPTKPSTVNYLLQTYIPPAFGRIHVTEWEYHQYLDNNIPWCFVHKAKDGNLYMVDGHHRAALDYMVGRRVRCIFLTNPDDLADAHTLVDMEMIPPFKLEIKSQIEDLSHDLPEARERYALRTGVRNFDDFCGMLSTAHYIDFVYGIGPMGASGGNADLLSKMWATRGPILEWSEDFAFD